MIKFALTGSHGTGKSTLLEEVRAKISTRWKINVANEAARDIVDMVGEEQFFQRGNNSLFRQALIFVQHLAEEQLQTHNAPDALITDRTLVDHIAYTEFLFPGCIETSEWSILKNAAFKSLKAYEQIFLLPIEFAAIADGVRETDEDFRQEIDRAIRRLYEEAGRNVYLVGGPLNLRVETVATEIAAALSGQHHQ